jgi:phosphonate metabolism protein PhnN/1,5-bisphosphokinase (PRPP-forming)
MTPARIAHSERLIVVVGPSGAGKDSVLREWQRHLAAHVPMHFARRVIDRPASSGGEAHEAVSPGEFARLLGAGALATAWQANGLHYGVRHGELHPLARGGWVVMNGSRANLPQLRMQAPALHAVMITASAELLAARLKARGRERGAALAGRLQRRVDSLADVVIDNSGDLSAAVMALQRWWAGLR